MNLGKKLLAEVEEVGLDEVLNTLQAQHTSPKQYFAVPQLDALVRCAAAIRSTANHGTIPSTTPPIVELMSLRPDDGKTQFLYHLTAAAILPLHLGGNGSAVIYFDMDNRFSVSRLAQHVRHLALTHNRDWNFNDTSFRHMLEYSLRHVHVYTPHSLASTVATLQALPHYLFNPTEHHSFDRRVGFIALDSVSAFYWQSRAESEEVALLTSKHPTAASLPQRPVGYIQLAAAVKNTSRSFAAPVIFTCRDISPRIKDTSAFTPDGHSIRPSLPPPWQGLPMLRLVVQRAPLRKVPVEFDWEDIVRDSEMQKKVIEKGKFEVFVNEWSLEERELRSLRREGAMFEFFVTADGVKIGEWSE